MKVGIITTIDTNIGDDFIREGLLHVLSRMRKGYSLVLINKHAPSNIYPRSHPLNWPVPFTGRLGRYYTRALDSMFYRFSHSAFDSCDLIIQAGAPVFFDYCASTEWSKMVWEHVVCRLAATIPVLNLAAGSCYPWERIPQSIPLPKDERFIRRIADGCLLTTVRDSLAQKLLCTLGIESKLIACSAFLAANNHQPLRAEPTYVFINYMRKGTHFDFDQHIDADLWEEEMRTLIQSLKMFHKVAFICHNEEEYCLAHQLDETLPRFFPKTVADYFRVASMGIAGVFNRMHACVGFAGLGIPSIGVGGDTRMLMVDALGLQTVFVKEAKAIWLLDKIETMIQELGDERERLNIMHMKVQAAYESVIGSAISLGS